MGSHGMRQAGSCRKKEARESGPSNSYWGFYFKSVALIGPQGLLWKAWKALEPEPA